MTNPIVPQVILAPSAQAQIDADPAKAKALRGFTECFMNAMQGVEDGRYKCFEDAMEAMTGHRPEPIDPPHPPKYGYYLGVGPMPGDGLMAAITDGNPHEHDDFEIMAVRQVVDQAEAEAWFHEIVVTLPWREKE